MSGRQEYREFRPVELYDVAAVESWLEERDREGYHLLRFRGLYGIFCQIAVGFIAFGAFYHHDRSQ